MHYVIVGAGAIGGTIGARLFQQGHRVTLVARGGQVDAVGERGLRFVTPEGEQQLPIPVLAAPTTAGEVELEPESVLVLAVKSQDTAAALAIWADMPVRGGGTAATRLPVICAQNGIANEPAALRFFSRVYAACVWLPATYLEPGTVAAESLPYTGMLQLGRYPYGVDQTVRQVAADFSAARLMTVAREDAMRWKRGKLLGNLGNGVQALFAAADRDLYRRVRAEGTAVFDAAGLPYTSQEEEVAQRGDLVRVQPVAGHQRVGSSTAQSLARGTSAEVDYLNGEVVQLGRCHAVATPVNLAVQLAVRQAVRRRIGPGQFPAEEFQAMLQVGTQVGGAGPGGIVDQPRARSSS